MKWYDWVGAMIVAAIAAWMLTIGVRGALASEKYMDNHTSCMECHSRFPSAYGSKLKKDVISPIPPNRVEQLCYGCHNPTVFGLLQSGGGTTPKTEGVFKDATGFSWVDITVYMDMNQNGKFDMGEPTAVTDENGYFVINEVGFPIRPVEGTIHDGYVITSVVQDGIVTILSTAKQATVEGYVWADIDNNRKFGSNDNGMGNVIVFSDLNGNRQYNVGEPVTLTNADGSYLLVGITINPTEVYCDIGTVPEGYNFIGYNNPVKVIPQPSQIVADVNFGFISPISVTSTIKYPTRIAVTSTGYMVTDPKAKSVFIFDFAGGYTGQIKELVKPLGIDTDEYGNIYVGTSSGIDMYNSNGKWLGIFGLGQIKKPIDIVYHQDGLYVLDSIDKNIKVFKNGATYTIGDGQFNSPVSMAIRGNGLYVADKGTFNIKVFDLDGNVYSPFGGQVQLVGMMNTLVWEGLFQGLQSIVFDKYGRLHVLDSMLNKVQVLSSTGSFIEAYDVTNGLQLDIDIAPNGDVFMTNVSTQSVEKIYTVE
jgi:hypothetical protein